MTTRARFTQEEADEIIRLHKAGVPVASLVEKYGRQRTIYRVIQEAAQGVVREERRPADHEIRDAIRRWDEGAALGRISLECGRSRDWVRRVLRDAGREHENRPYKAAPGDRVKHTAGYMLVHVADDDSCACMRTETGLVLEHRLVMARTLGRPLEEWETVHHINGVRDDNRAENLQLRKGNHGQGVVMRCRRCGSHDIENSPLDE